MIKEGYQRGAVCQPYYHNKEQAWLPLTPFHLMAFFTDKGREIEGERER